MLCKKMRFAHFFYTTYSIPLAAEPRECPDREARRLRTGYSLRFFNDYGQLVSVRGVTIISCTAVSAGMRAAKIIAAATLAGSCKFSCSGIGMP
jgi:hypothetical protein